MKPNYHQRPQARLAFRPSLQSRTTCPVRLNAQQDGLSLHPTPYTPPAQATPFMPSQAQLMKGVQSVISLGDTHKGPSGEAFAVIEFDGTLGPGGILVAVLVSFHFSRAGAESACKSKMPEGGCGNA